ncbi:hypothetical protein BDN71DRAFT_1405669, partial [Pleurotus eryngii]
LLHPFSRGHVHIRSSDPFDSPIIDPRFLNNTTDIELFIDAVRLVRKVVNARCIKSSIVRETVPGPAVQFDAEIVHYLKGNVQTIYHPIGTAPMFTREEGGVVDESLKVYGTGNLRVVDASVIPLQISAHIQHTTFAIAEKVKVNSLVTRCLPSSAGCRHHQRSEVAMCHLRQTVARHQ